MSVAMIEDVLRLRDIAKSCPLCGRYFSRVGKDLEHVFPRWLQKRHNLWTRKLTLPNFVGRKYKSIRVFICPRCNNQRFGELERMISGLTADGDAFDAMAEVDDHLVAAWLGKIFWLLCRKSHISVDPKAPHAQKPTHVLDGDIMRGVTYLGVIERAHAMSRGMYACFRGDPPNPEYFYSEPYSLYRFRIDTSHPKTEAFDFKDNPIVLGAAIRTGTFGVVCLYDGGLHRFFRSHWLMPLWGNALHPHQFNELVGRIFYDQLVLDDAAQQVQYFWNQPLKAVVAMNATRRSYNPYLQENHDPLACAEFVARYVGAKAADLLTEDGKDIRTALVDDAGKFLLYPSQDV